MADEIQKNVINHAQPDMAASPGMSHDAPTAAPAGRKFGAEHVKGMVKLGFHELTQALAAFPDSNIRPMEEPGVVGNETMPHITPKELSYNDRLEEAAAHGLGMQQNRDHERGR